MSCEKLQDLFSDEEETQWLKKDGWLHNERDIEMVIAETTSLKSKDLLLEGDQEMEHEESQGNPAQQDEQDSDEEQEGSDSLISPLLTDEEIEHSERNTALEGDSNKELKYMESEFRDLSQVAIEDGEMESRDNVVQHAQEDSEVEQNSRDSSFRDTEMEVDEGSGGLQEDSEVVQEVAGVRDPVQKKDGCTKELVGGILDSSHLEEELGIGYQAPMLEPEKEGEFEGRFHLICHS